MITRVNIEKPPLSLFIGYAGENEFRKIEFDVTSWKQSFPNGKVSIIFTTPGPGQETYPVVVNSTDNPIIWSIPSNITSIIGQGKIIIRIMSDDIIGKTCMILTVSKEASDFQGVPPDHIPDWVQDILILEDTTRNNAEGASNYANIAFLEANRSERGTNRSEIEADRAEREADRAEGEADRAEGEADRAGSEADRAEGEADRSEGEADRAGHNILNGVMAHNESEAAHAYIQSEVSRVEAIARGRVSAKAFDTHGEMESWLDVPENVETLNIGDNLYIRDLNVPDYWWDGEQIQELEAQAVNLSDYYTKAQIDMRTPVVIEQDDYDGLVNEGEVVAGRIYYVVPDGTLGGDGGD